MLNIELPVWSIRAYLRKYEEDGFIIIETIFNRYILDKPSLVGNFEDRRVQLFEMRKNLKYRLYPLKAKILTVTQLLNSKAKKFIDRNGKVVSYVKVKFYNIQLKRVLSCTQIYNGKYQHYVSGVPYPIVTRDHYEYISVINIKGSYVVFDLHKGRPSKVRTRIKV